MIKKIVLEGLKIDRAGNQPPPDPEILQESKEKKRRGKSTPS